MSKLKFSNEMTIQTIDNNVSHKSMHVFYQYEFADYINTFIYYVDQRQNNYKD